MNLELDLNKPTLISRGPRNVWTPKTDNIKHIQILPVGGYGKLIANMTIIRCDKKFVIIDCGKGLQIPSDWSNLTPRSLSRCPPTFPSFSAIDALVDNNVELDSIIITHCHGDHLAGLEQLLKHLQSKGISKTSFKIYSTRYTKEMGRRSVSSWPNASYVELEANKQICLFDKCNLEPFLLDHSSLHSVALYFHFNTVKGVKKLLFLPDHRRDYNEYPDVRKLSETGAVDQIPCAIFAQQKIEQIVKKKLDMVILESTNLRQPTRRRCTEIAVYHNLRALIAEHSSSADSIIVSTYSTNPMRLKSVISGALLCGRKVAIIGRSMWNGFAAGSNCNLYTPEERGIVSKFENLAELSKKRNKYVILCTGHMGQYNATLPKLLRGDESLAYKWSKKDLVIVASETIPKQGPLICRSFLRSSIMTKRIKYVDGDYDYGLHTSGHISYKDYLYYLDRFKDGPRIVLNHGDYSSSSLVYGIVKDQNMNLDVQIPLDGQTLSL